MMTRRGALLGTLALVPPLRAAGDDAGRVLVVVGPSSHPPGTHEVAAGGRVLKHCLEAAGLPCRVAADWPKSLAGVLSVVFLGDLFPPAVMKDGERAMADLAAFTKGGGGIVCVHYAAGLEGKHVRDDGDHALLRWVGGYYATRCKHHQSLARVYPKATVTPAAGAHPVARGWKAFTVHDEPYVRNYFGPKGPAPGVTVVATAELPPEAPKPEAVAWAADRPDGGRGAAVVMPHFFRNWADPDLRKLILNAVVWTARRDVPKAGVDVKLPALASFKPASVEPVPRKK